MKVALLGGTFNPIHNGHMALANAAFSAIDLDKLIFIPTFIPPHKDIDGPIDPEARLAMIKLASNINPKFEISRLELDRRNVSYTIDTISFIKNLYSRETELFFILGSDSLNSLESWKDSAKLKEICKFIVGIRPDNVINNSFFNAQIIPMEPLDISSSDIRVRIKSGKDISNLVPKSVCEYIERHNLYL